ncbi:MAG: lytic transglycosylase domain-containing protein [Acidobacteriia bacterium]|nr:lytic transglycosylase domain-containing protein [Terriglobia bacterium]
MPIFLITCLLILGNIAAAASATSVVRADNHSGKLVRVVLGESAPDRALASTVDRIAAEQALPPELVHSVIKAESNYNPFAVSPKGAMGIMQLIPETARRFGVSNAFNPEENIQGGAKYLKHLLEQYHGDYALALAAYNAGEGAVARHGGVPPYPETRNYVEKVLSRAPFDQSRERKGAVMPPAPSLQFPAPGEPQYNRIQQIVEPDGTVRYVSR